MHNSQHFQRDSSHASLAAIGGEPLAGSGFEAEEPDPGFSSNERSNHHGGHHYPTHRTSTH
jgi:hypothetical protein